MAELTVERLRELIHYDPDTGVFTRAMVILKSGVKVGDVAGGVGSNGYWRLKVGGRRYYSAHRLAWFYMTGAWPVLEIDHRDGNPLNNTWANLREATSQQNKLNRGANRNNRLGFKGVVQSGSRYTARIKVNLHQRHLGTFDTPEEANAAYMAAATEMFGEFARAA